MKQSGFGPRTIGGVGAAVGAGDTVGAVVSASAAASCADAEPARNRAASKAMAGYLIMVGETSRAKDQAICGKVSVAEVVNGSSKRSNDATRPARTRMKSGYSLPGCRQHGTRRDAVVV